MHLRAPMPSIANSVGRFRKPMVILAAGALAMSMYGAVGAATPSNGLIKACVDKTTKVTRVTIYASPTWCKSTEAYKWWNQTGVAGPKGATGPQGATGSAGQDSIVPGPQGATGAMGPQGATGADGPQGATGENSTVAGPQGDTGELGPQGATGENSVVPGPQGDTGEMGPQGATGENSTVPGPQGATGPQGAPGQNGGLNSVTQVTGTTEPFGGNDNVGTTVTATATCPSGSLVSGGGDVNGNNGKHYAVITSSYPSSATTWTVIATLFAGTDANGNPPSLTAYALCGA